MKKQLQTIIDAVKFLSGNEEYTFRPHVQAGNISIFGVAVDDQDNLWLIDQAEDWAMFELTDRGAELIVTALTQRIGTILMNYKQAC